MFPIPGLPPHRQTSTTWSTRRGEQLFLPLDAAAETARITRPMGVEKEPTLGIPGVHGESRIRRQERQRLQLDGGAAIAPLQRICGSLRLRPVTCTVAKWKAGVMNLFPTSASPLLWSAGKHNHPQTPGRRRDYQAPSAFRRLGLFLQCELDSCLCMA